MLIDRIFKFLKVIKQTFCIHQYKGKAKGVFGTGIYYQCVKCGRIIQHKPPKQLMYKKHKKEFKNENN